MTNVLSRKVLVFGVVILLVWIGIIPSMGGYEVKKQCSTHINTFSESLVGGLKSEMPENPSVAKTATSVNNGLPDLIFNGLRAWWGSLNTTGIFVDFDVNNTGDTYYNNEPIVSNLSFFADDNATSFGYILQSPMFYPSTWYHGEILGGCNFFEMDEKPDTITVKIDFTNLIPESNEANNNLTISVLLGVTISGSIYKNENSEIIPFKGIIELSQYDEDSLSDFGYRHYWSDENGHYNMSLCPREPLSEPCTYNIMARNTSENLKILKKSDPVKTGENTTLDFLFSGEPPDKPNKPYGRKLGRINRTYMFFSSSSDPNNDIIYYKFDWGDRTYSEWLGPYASNELVSASHAWSKLDTYTIKVISKDSLGMLSRWSDPLTINLPENKQLSNRLLPRFLERISEVISIFLIVKLPFWM